MSSWQSDIENGAEMSHHKKKKMALSKEAAPTTMDTVSEDNSGAGGVSQETLVKGSFPTPMASGSGGREGEEVREGGKEVRRPTKATRWTDKWDSKEHIS